MNMMKLLPYCKWREKSNFPFFTQKL